MNQEFVPHPTIPNYEASRDGTVRHCKRRQPVGFVINSGYLTFTVGKKHYLCHRFVYECHHGEIPKGFVIDHINGNRLDNNIENLRVVTPSENSLSGNAGRCKTAARRAIKSTNTITDGHVDTIHQICKGYGLSRVTTKDTMMYISCNARDESPDNTGVYGFDILNPSQCKYTYKHQRLQYPTSIVINEDGDIFVCNGLHDSCIHQLTASCQLVAIFTQGIPRYLQALFWDNGRFYGTCLGSRDITVFQPVYQGSHKASEVLVSNERKQPVIEETAIQIGQGNVPVDQGQSSVATEMPPSGPVPEDSEDDKQDPVIPVEILRMDDKSLQLYKNALRDGKEKIYNIRVMVVGQFGVGKTTLTKRLLGKPVYITERKSTEGIDVYKHCCKISLDTGEWIVQLEDSDQLSRLQRLMELLSGPDQKTDISQEQEGHREVVYERETTPEADNTQMSEAASISRSGQEDQMTYSQPAKLSAIKKDGGHGMAHSDQETSTVTVTKSEAESSNKERKDAVIEILHLINENADKLETDIVKYAALSIWDFAGQYAFYTTHQTFLSSRALYLLVIDLNQQITDVIKDDKCFLDMEGIKLCKVHDLVEIWMNSIHTCASSPEASIPHVVLVGTHVDKLSEKSRKQVIKKYFEELRYILKDKPTIRHLMDHIAIDNTQSDPMLEILKRKIFELASQQQHWGEERPARWLPLEQKIMTLKASGAKVVARSLIEEINMSGSVRIEDSDELDLFLIFHHEMGTILYFSVEGLREKIVLDPQWLFDALKSLITAKTFIEKYPAITSKWYEFEETGKLTHELIDTIWTEKNNQEFRDNKGHILLLMEKLNIIARPRSFTEDGNIKESNYFLAPCMLQQKAPAEVICPKPNDQMGSSSVLCFVFIGNFMPSPIFHRLLAACVTQWPIAINNKEEKQENQIFCGCCVFELDQLHNLTLHFKEFIIFVRVTKMGIKDKTPSSKLCIEAREFINTNLLKIIGYLGQSLKFEYFIQCPEYSGESVNSLIPVSQLKENAEVRCKLHNNVIESCNLLKFWFEDNEQTGDVDASSAVPMPPGGGDTDRFMRLTYLLVDVGSRILRQLLSHHTVTLTCTLDQYLAKNKGTINSLLKRKVLHQSQMDILFPPNGGNTNLEDYDVTLLSALFNNIVPSLTQQEEDMIKSLREDRNKLYGHAKSCKMNAMEYQTCWKSISSTLITLSQQCGDPNFQNEISQEIQRIQVSAIPTGSYLDILKTWFSTIETVKGSLETAEGEIQALKSRLEALELKKAAADCEGK